jgi:large conductance mechanosensitive channel
MYKIFYSNDRFYLNCNFVSFALQGNVLDLAIGIIIGTAFTNVVQSLVDDILTPPFGLLFDGVDFANLTIKMRNFVRPNQPPVVIRYGRFIQQIIYLLIVAFVLFFVVKFINKLRELAAKKKAERQHTELQEFSEEVKVLREIRDLLAHKTTV